MTGAGALDLAGYHVAFLVAASVMALGVIFSCFVNDGDAAATMAAVPHSGEGPGSSLAEAA